MTRTFNPNLLQMPIFRTLDIAVPVLTPLVNFDQLISLMTGLPRGTVDNIVNNVHLVNNFLSTPGATKVSEKNFLFVEQSFRFSVDAFNHHGESIGDDALLHHAKIGDQSALRELDESLPNGSAVQPQSLPNVRQTGESHRVSFVGSTRETRKCSFFSSIVELRLFFLRSNWTFSPV